MDTSGTQIVASSSTPGYRSDRRRVPGLGSFALIFLSACGLLFPGAVTRAQTGGQGEAGGKSAAEATIYLSAGHPAYGTLERLRGAGLLAGAWLNRRPLSRITVARALRKGLEGAREGGLHVLAEEVGWRLRDFAREPGTLGGDTEPRGAPLKIEWADEEGAWLNAEMNLEIGFDTRKDLPPDFTGALVGRGGIEVYGEVEPGVGYLLRYRQNSERREGTIKRWPYSPDQTASLINAWLDQAAYNETVAHVSWDGRHMGMDLCMDSPAWGPSPERNLMLSGHAPSFGHLQTRVALGDWLRYTVLFGSLRSGIVDTVRSYMLDDPARLRELERSKYLFGHRMELKPFPALIVGFNEMGIVSDRFPELHYFVPTISIWDAEHYLNDPDNTMMGFDFSWAPTAGPRLYGAVALDEWTMGEAFSDSTSHNWLAFQAGASWTPPFDGGRWNLWVEATRVLPNVYRHEYPVNDWTHINSWLGFWTGQNSEVIQGRLTYLASPRLRFAFWGRYARKGGEVTREEQYTIPPSEKFMLGKERLGAWVGGLVTFEGERHWQITAELVRAPGVLWPHDRDVNPSLSASLGQDWQLFVRWVYNPF